MSACPVTPSCSRFQQTLLSPWRRLIASTANFTAAELARGAAQLTTTLKHKYGEEVGVHVKIQLGGMAYVS